MSHSLVFGLQQIVEAGKILEQAVDDFKQRDGHWKHLYSRMLKAAKISRQLATTLRAIASHPCLSNPDNMDFLPPSISTLGELATLPETEVQGLIESGGRFDQERKTAYGERFR